MYQKINGGFLEVITGGMFAGKTEELIRRVSVLKYGLDKIQVFKPIKDNRYQADKISSHSGSTIDCILVNSADDIYEKIEADTTVVAIDEVQFFDEDMIDLINYLTRNGVRVMVAGLDKDFRGEPFGIMPNLITSAEFVTKLTAVCTSCGAPATMSQRTIDGRPAHYNDEVVMVGADDKYTAVCRMCHEVPGLINKYADKSDLKNYLDYPILGSGTGRIVFDLGDGTVAKVAFNEAGVEQNKTEFEISKIEGIEEIFNKQISLSNDGVVSTYKKGQKINSDHYHKLLVKHEISYDKHQVNDSIVDYYVSSSQYKEFIKSIFDDEEALDKACKVSKLEERIFFNELCHRQNLMTFDGKVKSVDYGYNSKSFKHLLESQDNNVDPRYHKTIQDMDLIIKFAI